jgi:hypothetical protein
VYNASVLRNTTSAFVLQRSPRLVKPGHQPSILTVAWEPAGGTERDKHARFPVTMKFEKRTVPLPSACTYMVII